MSESYSPTVEALIEACTAGLAKSEFLYRDDWPDVGRVARKQLRERVVAVLTATGIPLDSLADIAIAHRPLVGRAAPAVEPLVGRGKPWCRWWK